MRALSPKLVVPLVALVALAAAASWGGGGPPAVVADQEVKEITVDPVQDTYIATAIEIPLGSATTLRAGWRKGAEILTLIQFDFLPEMGNNAEILWAQLEMYCIGTEQQIVQDISNFELRLIIDKWDEGTVTVKRPPHVASKLPWKLQKCDVAAWRSIEVTNYVKDWYSGRNSNFGWQIAAVSDTPETLFNFNSRDGQPPSPLGFRPRLRIRWRGGSTPTFTPSTTPTSTDTPTPTATFTPSMTPTVTDTPTITPTATVTDTPEPPEGVYLPLTLRDWELGSEAPVVGTPEDTAEPTPDETPPPPTQEPPPVPTAP